MSRVRFVPAFYEDAMTGRMIPRQEIEDRLWNDVQDATRHVNANKDARRYDVYMDTPMGRNLYRYMTRLQIEALRAYHAFDHGFCRVTYL